LEELSPHHVAAHEGLLSNPVSYLILRSVLALDAHAAVSVG
jgi:hypothetical protein